MVYGYVNKNKGETEEYFDDIETDCIKVGKSGECDLSFLSPGDTLVIMSLKTLTNDLKDMLSLAHFAYKNDIKIKVFGAGEENMLDSDTTIGQMMLSILSGLNEFDNKYYGNTNKRFAHPTNNE